MLRQAIKGKAVSEVQDRNHRHRGHVILWNPRLNGKFSVEDFLAEVAPPPILLPNLRHQGGLAKDTEGNSRLFQLIEFSVAVIVGTRATPNEGRVMNRNPLGCGVPRYAFSSMALQLRPFVLALRTRVSGAARRWVISLVLMGIRRLGENVASLLALRSKEISLQSGDRDAGCGQALSEPQIGLKKRLKNGKVTGCRGAKIFLHSRSPRQQLVLGKRKDNQIRRLHATPNFFRKSGTSG